MIKETPKILSTREAGSRQSSMAFGGASDVAGEMHAKSLHHTMSLPRN